MLGPGQNDVNATKGLPVNRKRVLRVMRERGLLVRSRRLRAQFELGSQGCGGNRRTPETPRLCSAHETSCGSSS
jgi:hypothetical protein